MKKVCLKSKWLVAIIMLVITLAVVIGGCSVNGRYQMTCVQDGEHSRAFVIDTQTGEVRDLEIETYIGYKYREDGGFNSSRPWPSK